MTDDYRQAKADVKAEKARVKAMRPWFKKKRFIIPLAFVALIVAISAAGAGGGDSDGDNESNATSNGVDSDLSTNTKNPPAADVKVTGCRKTIIDTVEVDLEVTNHSSKESSYLITLGVEDASGAKIGDATASTNNVDPGQTARVQGVGTLSDSSANFTCVLEEVERYAS